jgi:hypothetical protein
MELEEPDEASKAELAADLPAQPHSQRHQGRTDNPSEDGAMDSLGEDVISERE